MIPTNNKEDFFSLKGGILIIGSLLWQDYLDKADDNIRQKWRAEYLDMDKKIMVRAPIRYGRLSKKDNIFTMIFSKSVSKKKYGTGYFIPLKNSNVKSEKEMFNEAIALSNSEGMKGEFVAGWGALGILFNEQKIDIQLKKKLTIAWQEKILQTKKFDYKSYKLLKKEPPCIKPNGLLNFDWVLPVDKRQIDLLNSYDFILATATQPTEYPTIKKLSENVRNDNKRFYFIENYKNGITTFQDISILNSF